MKKNIENRSGPSVKPVLTVGPSSEVFEGRLYYNPIQDIPGTILEKRPNDHSDLREYPGFLKLSRGISLRKNELTLYSWPML